MNGSSEPGSWKRTKVQKKIKKKSSAAAAADLRILLQAIPHHTCEFIKETFTSVGSKYKEAAASECT